MKKGEANGEELGLASPGPGPPRADPSITRVNGEASEAANGDVNGAEKGEVSTPADERAAANGESTVKVIAVEGPAAAAKGEAQVGPPRASADQASRLRSRSCRGVGALPKVDARSDEAAADRGVAGEAGATPSVSGGEGRAAVEAELDAAVETDAEATPDGTRVAGGVGSASAPAGATGLRGLGRQVLKS